MSSLDKQEANNEHLTSARYWEELLGLREKERLFHDSEAQLAEREQKVAAREARLEADFSEMLALRAQLLTESTATHLLPASWRARSSLRPPR